MKSPTWRLIFLSFTLLALSGCAYFRWKDPSYEEVHDRAEKDKAGDQGIMNPLDSKTPFSTDRAR
jgi:hypothetical protein